MSGRWNFQWVSVFMSLVVKSNLFLTAPLQNGFSNILHSMLIICFRLGNWRIYIIHVFEQQDELFASSRTTHIRIILLDVI